MSPYCYDCEDVCYVNEAAEPIDNACELTVGGPKDRNLLLSLEAITDCNLQFWKYLENYKSKEGL